MQILARMATVSVGLDAGLEIIMWPWLGLEKFFFVLGLGVEKEVLALALKKFHVLCLCLGLEKKVLALAS